MLRHAVRFGVAVALALTMEWVVMPPAQTPAASNPTLRQGAVGPLVAQAQQLLNARAVPICGRDKGCLAAYRLNVDGRFGPRTERTLRIFQAQQDLEIDGIIGINTWNELVFPTPHCVVAKKAWVRYGGSASQANLAVKIAERESGCRLQAVNRNSRTRDNSHGPWQINYYGKLISRERTIAPISANHASWRSAIQVVLHFVRTTGLCHWRTARC